MASTTSNKTKEGAYEADIQKFILNNPDVFHITGNNSVLFEKKLPGRSRGSVIADVAIFSSEIGTVGVEIKTAHDTTKRLKHQIEEYSKTFDYVYVLCADNQYEHVMATINNNKFDRVGVITYDEYKGEIITGEMQKATYGRPDPRNLYRMMWRKELLAINKKTTTYYQTKANKKHELGLEQGGLGMVDMISKAYGQEFLDKNSLGARREDGRSTHMKNNLSKEAMISAIFKRLGVLGATQLALDLWVSGVHMPEKVLRYYHFSKKVENVFDFKPEERYD